MRIHIQIPTQPETSHNNALTIPRRLRGILRLLNLANHQIECLGHVIIETGTGLCETAIELLG